MLQITCLNTGYGDTQVLHDVNLTVGDRELVVVLGPNGHGKTTLLRTISGLLPAWSGTVTFEGVDLTALAPHRIVQQGVVHIPQGDLLFPDLTVLDNLLMGAYLPAAWKERRRRLETVFENFPRLKERARQLARTLSGGERRMLALGRGLMTPAKVYLIDEPSLGLAPLLVEEVYQQIHHIARLGIGILLVDENATHAPGLANRLCLLESGRIVREGDPNDLMKDDALQTAYLGV